MTAPEAATVYVIDDDDAVRHSLLFLLEVEGFRAQGFAGVEAFLAAVPEHATGCVISDMCMPGLDGGDLLRLLPTHRKGLPIIPVRLTDFIKAVAHVFPAAQESVGAAA